jgi:hypothetical protein
MADGYHLAPGEFDGLIQVPYDAARYVRILTRPAVGRRLGRYRRTMAQLRSKRLGRRFARVPLDGDLSSSKAAGAAEGPAALTRRRRLRRAGCGDRRLFLRRVRAADRAQRTGPPPDRTTGRGDGTAATPKTAAPRVS